MRGPVDTEDQLNPKAKRLIEATRAARTPGEADKRRVGAALALALGASATGGAGIAASATGAAKLAGGLSGLKVVVAALLLASATGAGVAVWMHGRPTDANVRPVVAPPGAPGVAPPSSAVEPEAVDEAVDEAINDPLLAEVTLLRRAQRALHDGQPGKALELAARHAALYPKSQVGVERDGLRVFALCALGRKPEARALAAELLTRAPRSPLRASLAESCARDATR
jgi:hypothetical protein